MSRQILSYSDLSPDVPSVPNGENTGTADQNFIGPVLPTSHPKHSAQKNQATPHKPNRANNLAVGAGEGQSPNGFGGKGGGSAARKRRRKFQETDSHIHWDAQGHRAESDIVVNYEQLEEAGPENKPATVATSASKATTTNALSNPKKEKNQPSNPQGKKGKSKSSKKRKTTHEEFWDDSALIDAWDAAMDEYKAMHGDKDWKDDYASKQTLWHASADGEEQEEAELSGLIPTGRELEILGDGAEALDGEGDEEDDVEEPEDAEEEEEEEEEYVDESMEGGLEEGIFEDSGLDPENAGQVVDPSHEETNTLAHSNNALSSTATFPLDSMPDVSQMSEAQVFQKAMEASWWAGFWAASYSNKNRSSGSKSG